ncbi:MAG: cadmium resistance transporter [Methanobacterium sp.]|nr:cadmium resistance transporter [Methanobacterium sp.]
MITITAFISTNLDDLFILMAFFTRKDFPNRHVVLGQYLGMILLIFISSLAYFFQLIVPFYLVGLLGLIPIIIGIRNLLNPSKIAGESYNEVKDPDEGYRTNFKFLQVALVTFANGGDNIGVYAPLFAGMGFMELFQVIFLFLIMTGLWCLFSFKLVDNRILGAKIEKYGHLIFPFVLIFIGIFIILKGFLL